MYIPEEFIESLLNTINLVEVIQKRRQVERRGSAYMLKCPFHKGGEESNASMKIYEGTGTYHCFTCKETGNAISFLMKHDNLDFIEAIELLASYVGMEVPKQEKSAAVTKSTNINNKAAEIFYSQLKEENGKNTISYLKNRGISGEIAKFFNLGYANIKKPSLYEKLVKEFSQDELNESGLFYTNDDKEIYDRFRDRLIFPIRNIKGDCIAFGGRLLKDKKNQAKYLNSPKTKTYNKKYELYGLYEVRQINKRPDSIYVVEGYMDVISLFQHGVKNAVASSGTAFTIEQLRKILNYTDTIYIVFDGDEAGQKASWKTVENAMSLIREDTMISFIFLKEGDDPDSYIKNNGKEAFDSLSKNAKSLSDYFFETIKSKGDLSSLEGRTTAAKFALPLIETISNETVKQAYITDASNVCDLDFTKLLQGNKSKNNVSVMQKEEIIVDTRSIIRKSVLGIFIAMIQFPKIASDELFNQIKDNSRFSFLTEIKDMFIKNPDLPPSMFLAKIENEKIRNAFGEALVSEIKLSKEDALSMIKDCLELIAKSSVGREEILKEKYNIKELSSSEKRELQQIILKKGDKMSQEEAELIKNLSSN
ncbi:MAG: DNA primase [Gammaproteobacteria bacterium]|nr:DNA primase [Gammaproteobacteria bacterium]|tara:strand:+ start:6042 stop:7820 length:1779 start_codon:yes stop_codon:yes gene_type:complete